VLQLLRPAITCPTLGFYGVSRKLGNHAGAALPGRGRGQWSENAGAYGLAIGAVPSKRIPDVVNLFLDRFLERRQANEPFREFVKPLARQRSRNGCGT